jgi:hypothetical protein
VRWLAVLKENGNFSWSFVDASPNEQAFWSHGDLAVD